MITKKNYTLLTLILLPVLLHAQQTGYIRFKEPINQKEKGKELKLLKGEILPFFPDKQKDKIDVLFGKDTLKMVADLKKTEIVKSVSDHNGDKDQFVLSKKEDNMIVVDLNPLNPYADSVRFVTEDQKVTLFSKNKEFTISAKKAGRYPRLIILGSPTLFYDALDLSIYKQKKNKKMGEENPTGNGGFSGLLQLIIIIAILSCLIAWFCWWYFLKRHKARVPIYGRITQSHLSEFAKQHGLTIEKLLKLNPGIDQDYKQCHEQQKLQITKALKDQDLIVGYEKSKPLVSATVDHPEDPEKMTGFQALGQLPGGSREDPKPQTTLADAKMLETLLRSMEDRIIRNINGQNSSDQYIQEIKVLETKVEELKTSGQGLESKNEQLRQNNDGLNAKLREEENAAVTSKQELALLQAKVMGVDFLQEYCYQVKDFLAFMNSIIHDIYSNFQLLQEVDNAESILVASLLLKFEKSRCQKIQSWHDSVLEMAESGVTTNKSLKGIFNRFPQNSDKIYEFKQLLFDEVLSKEISALLIVAEEFKNLTKFFPSPSPMIWQIQGKFEKGSALLTEKSSTFGITPKYVGLFQNYLTFSVRVKSAGRALDAAYSNIGKFPKDTIIEICEFGFEIESGGTDTLVILNKYE